MKIKDLKGSGIIFFLKSVHTGFKSIAVDEIVLIFVTLKNALYIYISVFLTGFLRL